MNHVISIDWVDRCGHPSWSQEKALVCGFEAGKEVLQYVYGTEVAKCAPPIKPIAGSEPHVAIGRTLVKQITAPLRSMLSRKSSRMC